MYARHRCAARCGPEASRVGALPLRTNPGHFRKADAGSDNLCAKCCDGMGTPKGTEMNDNDGNKSRLTLWLEDRVKDELKEQARDMGVSASAYISVLVMQNRPARGRHAA